MRYNPAPARHRLFAVVLFVLFICTLPLFPDELNPDVEQRASKLKKLSLEEILAPEVTSVSKRPEKLSATASAIQVISGEDIKRSGATTLPEALRLAPNLLVAQVNASDWAINSRDVNSAFANKLLVMIDGRAIYTPLFAGVFWDVQHTFMEDIDRIEVISGPGGTLWGANAMNGVINIMTKSAQDTLGGVVTAGGGTELQGFGGFRYGAKLKDNMAFRVYGSHFQRDSSQFITGGDANDDWRHTQGGFRMDWDATEADLLTFQGDIYAGNKEQFGISDIHMGGGNLLGRWTHTFSEESDVRLQVYYDRTKRSIPLLSSPRVQIYDADLQHRFLVGERQSFVWGGGFRWIGDEVDNTALLGILPDDKTQRLWNFFLQDEIELVEDKLKLTLGSKFEHNDYTGWEVQPSGRLAWNLTERQTLWAAISRAVRTPSRGDREFYIPTTPPFFVAGGPSFHSEKLTAYELGYRVAPLKNLSLSMALFYHLYDDLASTEPILPFGTETRNELKGESYGVEFSGDYRPLEWWRLRGGYTIFRKDVRRKSGGQSDPAEFQEGERPIQQVIFQSIMSLTRHVDLDGVFRFIGEHPTPHVSSYAELDLRLAWHPTPQWEFSIVGQNLLHDDHDEFESSFLGGPIRSQIQRAVYGQITYRWP